jgi:hypothetical protein
VHEHEGRWNRAALGGFAALMLWLIVIYGPGIGHGFVKDDVAWVAANRVTSLAEARALFLRSNGFYRPLVAASFAADRAIYGIEPFGYGVTNLLLLIASAAALAWAARGVGLSAMAAVVAAAIWAFNFHGIHMAVLWLSGRTELWLVLCAFLSAGALVRHWPILTGIAALAAMLAKEEAVMLPAMLAGWAFVLADGSMRDRLRATARQTWLAWLALAVYFVLRARTGAYTPATSPWFYQFTFDPFRVVTNAGEYLDRACTFPLLAAALCALLAWRRPAWTPMVRRCSLLALIWLIGGYALTVFLPVRSSLYACLPSAGIAIFSASLIVTLWESQAAPASRRRLLAAIVVPVLLLPVYWSRNERWVELADLGGDTFAMVRRIVRDTPEVRQLVFEDDRGTRRSLLNTYGALLPPAVTLATGRAIPVWLEPPPDDWRGSELVNPSDAKSVEPIAVIRLQQDRLARVR